MKVVSIEKPADVATKPVEVSEEKKERRASPAKKDSSTVQYPTFEQMSYNQLYFSLQLAFGQIEKLNTQQILMSEQLRSVLAEKNAISARLQVLEAQVMQLQYN